MSWRWHRLAAVSAMAAVGMGAGYIGLVGHLGRLAVMICGGLGIAGVVSVGFLLIFAYTWIEDDVRPSLRFREPVVPISISHSEPALVGRRRFRNHPVRFWGGLTLNNRLFVGFMLFNRPEYLELYETALAAGTRRAETRSKARAEGCQSGGDSRNAQQSEPREQEG